MRQEVLQVICAGLGTLGFALFFHVQARHLLLATLGGALSWVLYLAVLTGGGNVFVAALVSSLVVCLWAETFARVRKAPATIFLIPGIIPLLPGGSLYYTMSALIATDMETVILKGKETGMVAMGIVVGILVASEIVRVVLWVYFHREKFICRRLPPSR